MPDRLISPTPLPPAGTSALPSPVTSRPDRSRRLVLVTAGGVALLALLVVFVLPHLVAPAPEPGLAGAASDVAGSKTDAEPPDPLLTEEEKAAARLDAQDALAEVLAAADAIAAREVASWNTDGWQAAQARIAAGEKAYRQQRYPAAIRAYREAKQSIEALNGELPTVIAAARADADAAFSKRDGPLAANALERVLRLAPGDPEATRALARARNLERADALVAQAQGYERLGDLAQAKVAFEAALKLDPEEPTARKALARLAAAAAVEDFAGALSTGHSALAAGDPETAVAAFQRARKLQPDNAEAARALAQAQERQASARLERALASATRMEAAERWDAAAAALAEALSVDREMDALRPRLERARTRAALSSALERALGAKASLADAGPRAEAEATLARAKSVATPGPRLVRQIRALEAALSDARQSPPPH